MIKRKYSLFKIVLVLLVLTMSIKGIQLYTYNLKLKQKIDKLEQSYNKEQKVQKELLQKKNKMNTNEYYEQYARKVLGLVKKGEILFVDKAREQEKK